MLYKSKPKIFKPKFEVVSCLCEWEGKVLLLHRQDHKNEGNKWGTPAGKIDPGETAKQAMVREIWEETGIKIKQADLKKGPKLYVKYADYDFIYYMFSVVLSQNLIVKINPNEHKDFKLVTPKEALKMDLIEDEDTCLKLFYNL